MNQDEIKQHVIGQLRRTLTEEWSVSENKTEHNVLEMRHTIDLDQGLTIRLDDLLQQAEQDPDQTGKLVEDLVIRVQAALKSRQKDHRLEGNEKHIYPVLRHTSAPKHARDGKPYITRQHTSESVIYYALDLGPSYILIHTGLLEEADWSEDRLHYLAVENLAKLDSTPKTDRVGENEFFFISRTDGFAASRVLNPELLEWMKRKADGPLGVAFPHQDVLIFADLRDANGYKALAQIAMDFSMRGDIPISSIPFLYENGELEAFVPISAPKETRIRNPILGKKKK